MKKNQIQATILIVVVAFPLFLYFFVKYFSIAHFERLPFQYSLATDGDTVFHKMPDFSFTDQLGNPFTKADMAGDVYIVSFFDGTEEEHVTEKLDQYNVLLLANLKKVYNNAEDAPMVKLLTISTSPDTDSLPVLQFWSEKFGGDAERWVFAKGPIDQVWDIGLGAFSMKEFMERTRNRLPFTARAIALVDKEGNVRKYYEGTNDFAIEKQLFEDLRALLTLEYKEDFSNKGKKN